MIRASPNASIAKNMPQSKRVFLSAEWRDLVMLNYEVEPSLLNPYVPTRHVTGFIQWKNIHQPCGLSILPDQVTWMFSGSVSCQFR